MGATPSTTPAICRVLLAQRGNTNRFITKNRGWSRTLRRAPREFVGGEGAWRGRNRFGRIPSPTGYETSHSGLPVVPQRANGSGAFGGFSACACALMPPRLKNVKRSSFGGRRQAYNYPNLQIFIACAVRRNEFRGGFCSETFVRHKSKPPTLAERVGGRLGGRHLAAPGQVSRKRELPLRSRAFGDGSYRWLALAADGCARATGCTCRRSP